MGWESRRYYPVAVSTRVTVQATSGQKANWTTAARRFHKGTPGAFLAWAGDLILAFFDTYERETLRHAEDCNPTGSRL